MRFANCSANNVCNGEWSLYVRAEGITMSCSKCILTNEVSNQSNGAPPRAKGRDEAGSNARSVKAAGIGHPRWLR